MLPEEFIGADLVRVNDIYQRVRILGEARSEDNNFEMFMHALQELTHSGPDKNEDIANTTFDFDR